MVQGPGRDAPGWDWLDVDMIRAWRRLDESRCPDCGRPAGLHDVDGPAEYETGWVTCTAAARVQAAQARWSKSAEGRRSEDARREGRADPAAGRRWLAWRAEEGRPAWPGPDEPV